MALCPLEPGGNLKEEGKRKRISDILTKIKNKCRGFGREIKKEIGEEKYPT